MSELRKLLKAREKLITQREWAIAGAKFYENLQLSAQDGIRNIDLALETIQEEKRRSEAVSHAGQRAAKRSAAVAETRSRAKSDLPATGEAFWIGFLTHTGRGIGDVFNDALVAWKRDHKFVPTQDQCAKLRNRLGVAFHGAVQNKVILSTGKGRDRVYWLPKRRSSSRNTRKHVLSGVRGEKQA